MTTNTTSDTASTTECGLRQTMEQLRQEQSALERQCAVQDTLYATDSSPYIAPAIEEAEKEEQNNSRFTDNRRGVRPLTGDTQRGALRPARQQQRSRPIHSHTAVYSPDDANNNDNSSDDDDDSSNSSNTPGEACTGSLRARLQELDALKRKYQRSADRAMRRYLHSVSDMPRYQAEREARLRSARPFSFEEREKMRPANMAETRMAADRLAREEALAAELQTSFTASAVPASTFMNKYDLMVEEWKERKAAQRLVAQRKAERMKSEAEFVRLSASAMREVRAELREELPTNSPPRAHSAEAAPHPPAARGVTEIPLEVQLKLWPAVKEYEQVRKERIKSRAAAEKAAVEANVRKVLPSLSVSSPRERQRLMGFGDITAHAAVAAAAATASAGGGVYGIGAPPPAQQQQQQVQGTATTPAPAPAASAAAVMPAALREPDDVKRFLAALSTLAHTTTATTTTATATTITPGDAAAARPATAPHQAMAAPERASRAASADKRKARAEKTDNTDHRFAFRPRVTPGVPDFQRLWAEERVAMVERRTRKPPTVPRPFDLTPSARAEVVRGRRYIRPASQPPPPPLARTRTRSNTQGKKAAVHGAAAPKTQPITTADAALQQAQDEAQGTTTTTTPMTATRLRESAHNKEGDAGHTKAGAAAATGGGAVAVPKGTRAHALRTELVYAKYIRQASVQEREGSAAAAAQQAALRRRRAAARRVAPYLRSESAHVAHERAIERKVKELRAAMREAEAAAAARLAEMKARVERMPPLFTEPEHLDTLAQARTETEQEILRILHETGLTRSTIQQILSRPSSARGQGRAESIVGEEEGGAEKEKEKEKEESKAAEGSEAKKDELPQEGRTEKAETEAATTPSAAAAAPLPVPVPVAPPPPPAPVAAAVHHSDSDSSKTGGSSSSSSSSSSTTTTTATGTTTGKAASKPATAANKEQDYEDSFESDSASSSSSSSSAHSL